jgi:hypothetical protein
MRLFCSIRLEPEVSHTVNSVIFLAIFVWEITCASRGECRLKGCCIVLWHKILNIIKNIYKFIFIPEVKQNFRISKLLFLEYFYQFLKLRKRSPLVIYGELWKGIRKLGNDFNLSGIFVFSNAFGSVPLHLLHILWPKPPYSYKT